MSNNNDMSDVAGADGYSLKNLTSVSVVLGKNGCGKSTALKRVEASLEPNEEWGHSRYITPERGGVLLYEANVEHNMNNDPNWIPSTRRVNQLTQFRQQSMAQFRKLEILVLRRAEGIEIANFGPYIDQINGLLDNVEVRRDDVTFKIFHRESGAPIDAGSISSGESELISLAIECLVFAAEAVVGKRNLLFLDEPDVHLHPDLQARLIRFILQLVADHDLSVVIATHSTALLSGFSDYAGASVAFMKMGDKELEFRPIDPICRKVLPVFGAHPLSNVFNSAPVLLVEGDDDERVWQQAVRTSQGAVKLYPVSCDGLPALHEYETAVKRIVDAVYDDARAFSLRDGDDNNDEVDDLLPVIRMRLNCRAAENLILTDEVIASAGTTWDEVRQRCDTWLARNEDHARFEEMTDFKNSGYDRRLFDIKPLRMLLVGEILASNKPWEVLVGQALGQLRRPQALDCTIDGSLFDYLGNKVAQNLVPPA